jgi:phosphoenolpyruvate synthase/pyruvate phosphate dikinase
MVESGYKFFTNRKKVEYLQKKSKKTLKEVNKIAKQLKDIKISKLNNQELKRSFTKYFNLLIKFIGIYLLTEPGRFLKLEEKFKKFLKKKNVPSNYFLQLISLENKYYKRILNDLKAPKQIIDFVEIIRRFSVIRFNLRKAGEPMWYFILGIFLKEIAKRFKISTINLRYYTYQELLDLFKDKKVDEKIIKQRRERFGFIQIRGKRKLLNQKELDEAIKLIKLIEKGEKQTLTGQIAMKGKVIGKVRKIIHERKDLSKIMKKFKKGEILVTEMTRPQLATICHKAAAIITDEGGITSHAAVISRELKIPCIIGTKIATKVLKDGDLVEVNANLGTVKILKKEKL